MVTTIQSAVTGVTVYREGAMVTRRGRANLEKGAQELVFSDLSVSLVKESIQLRYSTGISCGKLEYRLSQEEPEEPEEPKEISEERKKLSAGLREAEDRILAAKKETQILDIFMSPQYCKPDSVESLEGYFASYKKYLEGLQEEIRDAEEKKRSLEEKVAQMMDAEIEKVQERRQARGEIVLDVSAEQEGFYDFEMSYYDRAAGWRPFYDITVTSPLQPICVDLKGCVRQNTGEDWKNVDVKISGGDMRVSNNQPTLTVWNLERDDGELKPFPLWGGRSEETTILEGPTILQGPSYKPDAPKPMQRGRAEGKEKRDAMTNVEYALNGKHNVQDGGKESILYVMSEYFPASYIYSCVPKAEEQVYLKAILNNDRQATFFECDANLFFENSYIGAVRINPRSMKNRFEISLGRTPKMTVKRRKSKDYTTEAKFKNMRKTEKNYEISVQNEGPDLALVEVYDQIPISHQADITVEVLDVSGAQIDQANGELKWSFQLAGRQKVSLAVKFAVTYPKGVALNL